jgi:hypothetical protein
MAMQQQILERLAALLPRPKDIFADEGRFQEHLFRSGLTPEVKKDAPRPPMFKH